MRKSKKTVVKAIIVYIVLTVGLWMFVYSYANSYNKLTDKKIVPAALVTRENEAELEIIGMSFKLDSAMISPESKLYFAAYLFMPVELRNGIRVCSNFLLIL